MAAGTQISGTITASNLNAAFDQFTSRIDTGKQNAARELCVKKHIDSLDNSTHIGLREIRFTPATDYMVRMLRIRMTGQSSADDVTLTLTPWVPYAVNEKILDDALTDFSNGAAIVLTVSPATAAVYNVSDTYSSADGTRLTLKKGIPYKLVAESAGATGVTEVDMMLLAETKQRRS